MSGFGNSVLFEDQKTELSELVVERIKLEWQKAFNQVNDLPAEVQAEMITTYRFMIGFVSSALDGMEVAE